MIAHIFKLIWNRKQKNGLMILEIFISFLVLFSLLSFALEIYGNRQVPDGIDYKKVWVVNFRWEKDTQEQADKKFKLIESELKNIGEVKNFSFARWSTPYSYSGSRSRVLKYGKKIMLNNLNADKHFVDVMGMKIIEGRNFSDLDKASKLPVYLISKKMVEEVFQNKNYLGETKTKENGENNMNIIGVYDYFQKESPLTSSRPSALKLNPRSKGGYSSVFLRVKEKSTAELEEKIIKRISGITKSWTLKLERLNDKRNNLINKEMLKVYTQAIISIFLILNVALGLFGVLWFNIENRKSEIGLRRVFGAVSWSIQKQILLETLILTFFGIFVGLFFVIQVPILNLFDIDTMIFIKSILISSVFILLISTLCALYPSKVASKLTPALVLHED
jgi:putative ABC transport system permease protein